MNIHLINKTHRNTQGFTIAELMIVVAVIAILAGIITVSYIGITARSDTTKSRGNATEIQKTMEQFNADRSTYPTSLSAITGFGTVQGDSSKFATNIAILKGPAGTLTSGAWTSAQLATVANTSGLEPLSATNGLSKVAYSYVNDPSTNVANGGVIIYWDYRLKGVAAAADYIYFGSASASSTFIAPAS